MKKAARGSSFYYVSDKNIFDALNQSKVDNETVRGMFARRNILCSRHTPRESLAKYFSTLTHDFQDHQDIAARLGIVSKRERTTSVDITSDLSVDELGTALEKLVASLKSDGDVVQISKDGKTVTLTVSYSEVDYKQNEFRQLQHRDGVIELVPEGAGWVLRSTQSEHMTAIRDDLLRELAVARKSEIKTAEISLFEYASPKLRSKFFYDLMNELPGFVRKDVTDVYVHKALAPTAEEDDEAPAEDDGDVQRVLMRGTAVSRSKILTGLLRDEKYFIFRIAWLATETLGKGYVYAIEALFHDAQDCRGFSYLVRGVHPLDEDGKLSRHRRIPTKSEADQVARAVETAARKVFHELTSSPGT